MDQLFAMLAVLLLYIHWAFHLYEDAMTQQGR